MAAIFVYDDKMSKAADDAPLAPTIGPVREALGMAATQDGMSVDEEPPPTGGQVSWATQQVGRFLLLRMLGQGGMGAVYAAFDEKLDRRVAIKLLHPSKTQSELLRERVLREAQAMARVSHKNVVPVYEVGEVGEQIFIAMEFVEGTTLREWQEKPHAVGEILRMYLEAGQGLLAAHEVGLIHRDFKADNVLIGKDGRPRVADFGLARLDGTQPPPAPAQDGLPSISGERLSAPLTVAGAISGTPGYMSPEQYDAGDVDARSDQFSFCAALYEALYGQLPFAGNSLIAIADNTMRGKLQPPPPGTKVPVEVYQALKRGLSADPAQRFATLRELLSALLVEQGHTAAGASVERRRFVNWFVAVVVLLHVFTRLRNPSHSITQGDQLTLNTSMLAVFFIFGALGRKTFLANAFHRRVYLLSAALLIQKLVFTLFGLYFALPFPTFFALDMVGMSGVVLGVAFLSLPALFWLPPLLLLVAAAAAYYGNPVMGYCVSIYPVSVAAFAIAWNAAADRAQRDALKTT